MPDSIKDALIKLKFDITEYDKNAKQILKINDMIEKSLDSIGKKVTDISQKMSSGSELSAKDYRKLEKALQEIKANIDKTTTSVEKQSNAVDKGSDRWKLHGQKLKDAKQQLKDIREKSSALNLNLVALGNIKVFSRMAKQILDVVGELDQLQLKVAEVATLLPAQMRPAFQEIHESQIRALSMEFGFDPKNVAKGFYDVISAGTDASKAVEMVGVAGKLAKAGVTDVATGVDALTSALNAYGASSEQASKFSDVMFKTVEQGKTTIKELAPVIGKASVSANMAGINFDQLGGIIAVVTASLGKTRPAITGISALFDAFSNKSIKRFKEMDIKLDGLVDPKSGKIINFLGLIKKVSEQPEMVQKQLIGSERAIKAFGALTASLKKVGTDGVSDLEKKLNAVSFKQAEGATESAYQTIANTTAATSKRMEATWNELKLKVADTLQPIVTWIKEALTGIMNLIMMIPKPAIALITVFGGFVGVYKIFQSITASVKALKVALDFTTKSMNVYMLVAAGVAAVATMLYFAFKKTYISVGDFTSQLNKANKELEKTKAIDANIDSYEKLRERISLLKNEIMDLTNKKQRTAEEEALLKAKTQELTDAQKQQSDIVNKLTKEYPNLANQAKYLGASTDELINKIREQNNSQREALETMKSGTLKAGIDRIAKDLGDLGNEFKFSLGVLPNTTKEALKKIGAEFGTFKVGKDVQDKWAGAFSALGSEKIMGKVINPAIFRESMLKTIQELKATGGEEGKKVAKELSDKLGLFLPQLEKKFEEAKTKLAPMLNEIANLDMLAQAQQSGITAMLQGTKELDDIINRSIEGSLKLMQSGDLTAEAFTKQAEALGMSGDKFKAWIPSVVDMAVKNGQLSNSLIQLANDNKISVDAIMANNKQMTKSAKTNLLNFIKVKQAEIDSAIQTAQARIKAIQAEAKADTEGTAISVKNAETKIKADEAKKKSARGEVVTKAEQQALEFNVAESKKAIANMDKAALGQYIKDLQVRKATLGKLSEKLEKEIIIKEVNLNKDGEKDKNKETEKQRKKRLREAEKQRKAQQKAELKAKKDIEKEKLKAEKERLAKVKKAEAELEKQRKKASEQAIKAIDNYNKKIYEMDKAYSKLIDDLSSGGVTAITKNIMGAYTELAEGLLSLYGKYDKSLEIIGFSPETATKAQLERIALETDTLRRRKMLEQFYLTFRQKISLLSIDLDIETANRRKAIDKSIYDYRKSLMGEDEKDSIAYYKHIVKEASNAYKKQYNEVLNFHLKTLVSQKLMALKQRELRLEELGTKVTSGGTERAKYRMERKALIDERLELTKALKQINLAQAKGEAVTLKTFGIKVGKKEKYIDTVSIRKELDKSKADIIESYKEVDTAVSKNILESFSGLWAGGKEVVRGGAEKLYTGYIQSFISAVKKGKGIEIVEALKSIFKVEKVEDIKLMLDKDSLDKMVTTTQKAYETIYQERIIAEEELKIKKLQYSDLLKKYELRNYDNFVDVRAKLEERYGKEKIDIIEKAYNAQNNAQKEYNKLLLETDKKRKAIVKGLSTEGQMLMNLMKTDKMGGVEVLKQILGDVRAGTVLGEKTTLLEQMKMFEDIARIAKQIGFTKDDIYNSDLRGQSLSKERITGMIKQVELLENQKGSTTAIQKIKEMLLATEKKAKSELQIANERTAARLTLEKQLKESIKDRIKSIQDYVKSAEKIEEDKLKQEYNKEVDNAEQIKDIRLKALEGARTEGLVDESEYYEKIKDIAYAYETDLNKIHETWQKKQRKEDFQKWTDTAKKIIDIIQDTYNAIEAFGKASISRTTGEVFNNISAGIGQVGQAVGKISPQAGAVIGIISGIVGIIGKIVNSFKEITPLYTEQEISQKRLNALIEIENGLMQTQLDLGMNLLVTTKDKIELYEDLLSQSSKYGNMSNEELANTKRSTAQRKAELELQKEILEDRAKQLEGTLLFGQQGKVKDELEAINEQLKTINLYETDINKIIDLRVKLRQAEKELQQEQLNILKTYSEYNRADYDNMAKYWDGIADNIKANIDKANDFNEHILAGQGNMSQLVDTSDMTTAWLNAIGMANEYNTMIGMNSKEALQSQYDYIQTILDEEKKRVANGESQLYTQDEINQMIKNSADLLVRLSEFDEQARLADIEHYKKVGKYEDNEIGYLQDKLKEWQDILAIRQAQYDAGEISLEKLREAMEAVYQIQKDITDSKEKELGTDKEITDSVLRRLIQQRQASLIEMRKAGKIDAEKLAKYETDIVNRMRELGMSDEDIAKQQEAFAESRKTYAKGGYVSEDGGLVHKGEYVLTKRATDFISSIIGINGMDKLNKQPPNYLKEMVSNINTYSSTSNYNNARKSVVNQAITLSIENNFSSLKNAQEGVKIIEANIEKSVNKIFSKYGKKIANLN